MHYKHWLGLAALVTGLSACGGPARFAIQGYQGPVRPVAETFTVRSQNGYMKLLKLDGNKGHFIPIASGPGAYAGFDVSLLPGKHQLEVYCWIDGYPYSTYSDNQIVEVEGQPGETLEVSCTPLGDRFHFGVRNVAPPQGVN
ncbi:hypothetical protein ACFPN1_15020 [Lysobacter yangpyeongensis]|uniref:Lipoprotein n=1 Tax=Lysobacter yangpyeongensis TaxID=346182 RepID=A0ABW0SQV5_9GAMM